MVSSLVKKEMRGQKRRQEKQKKISKKKKKAFKCVGWKKTVKIVGSRHCTNIRSAQRYSGCGELRPLVAAAASVDADWRQQLARGCSSGYRCCPLFICISKHRTGSLLHSAIDYCHRSCLHYLLLAFHRSIIHGCQSKLTANFLNSADTPSC